MNIIQMLSDKAYKNHLKNNPHSSFGRRPDYDKEFAELIIKECMDIIKPYAIHMNNFDGGHPLEDIKKHFNIK